MKERRFESSGIVCPYYKNETKGSIACSGFLPRSNVRVTFDTPRRRIAYRENFCAGEYEQCRVCRMLDVEKKDR